jgi:hydrogenase/urease accessory protein HupE
MSVFLSLSLIERTAANSAMDDVTGFLITLFFITVIGGFMYALFSLREPNSWRKILGLVVNIGLFLMLALNVYRNIGMF